MNAIHATMSRELFERYRVDPLGLDAEVHRECKVPEGSYYAVVMWPEDKQGRVYLTDGARRAAGARKTSKGDQP